MKKYIKLYDWLVTEIKNSNIQVGNKIPPEMELSKKFSLSRYSVRKAISMLESEGILKSIRGSGTYVTKKTVITRPKTKTIGVVISFIDDYIFPSILKGINEELSEHGYTIKLGATYNKVENTEKIIKSMIISGCDGLIIEPSKSALPQISSEAFDTIILNQVPCVFLNAKYPTKDFPYIAPDDYASGYLAALSLIEDGHTDLSAIFKGDDMQGHLRYQGYAQCLNNYNLPINEDKIIWYYGEHIDYLLSGNNDDYILNQITNSTAIICHDDRVAIKIINLLNRNSLQVPKDVSVVGFDDSNIASLTDIPLTTLSHPKEELGRVAASNLLALIDDPDFNATRLFDPKIIKRNSTRAIK